MGPHTDDVAMRSFTRMVLAGALAIGRLPASEAEVRVRALLDREELADHGQLCYAAPEPAQALLLQGRDDEALELTRVAEQSTATFDLESGAQWRKVRAKLLARDGRHGAAEELAREAVELACRTDLLALQAEATEDLAEVLASGGRIDEARAAAEDALRTFERKEHVVGAARTRRLLARLEAEVATR